ncbi:hypothetical protein GF325_03280 [Candidatus Bathyarchaeota archaeon]|nr:hypothetical protein [Candidatus Bathyarchaeota archaeon]
MHVIAKWVLIATGIVVLSIAMKYLLPTIQQFVALIQSLDFAESTGVQFELDYQPLLYFFPLTLLGTSLLVNGLVDRSGEGLIEGLKRLVKREKRASSTKPEFKRRFFSFDFTRLALSIIIIVAGLGWVWPTGTGSLRFGFFTKDFDLIFYGKEHALAPLDVFYFAGVPFIIVGLVLLLHTLFNTKLIVVNTFKDRLEFVVLIGMANYDSIDREQITSTEIGITKPRYKWVVAAGVIGLAWNVLIGWGRSNSILLPELSRQLLTSGIIIIISMIVFVLFPKKHIKLGILDHRGRRDVAEFKMSPVMHPKRWRDLASNIGVIPGDSIKQLKEAKRVNGITIEPAKDKPVGNLIDLLVGSILLSLGFLSVENKLIIVGVGMPVLLVIFGLRLVTRWLTDMPRREIITRTGSSEIYLYQNGLLGFNARRWNGVTATRVSREFKLPNFFDTFLILTCIAHCTWYMTRTWFPAFSYLTAGVVFWLTSIAIILPLAWRHFHMKPILILGQDFFNEQRVFSSVFLEKGLGEKHDVNLEWFKHIPARFKEYFATIHDSGLLVQFTVQVAMFSGFFLVPLVMQASGMAILLEGFPFYTLIIAVAVMGTIMLVYKRALWKYYHHRENLPKPIRSFSLSHQERDAQA